MASHDCVTNDFSGLAADRADADLLHRGLLSREKPPYKIVTGGYVRFSAGGVRITQLTLTQRSPAQVIEKKRKRTQSEEVSEVSGVFFLKERKLIIYRSLLDFTLTSLTYRKSNDINNLVARGRVRKLKGTLTWARALTGSVLRAGAGAMAGASRAGARGPTGSVRGTHTQVYTHARARVNKGAVGGRREGTAGLTYRPASR
jgi:hypothetical protein